MGVEILVNLLVIVIGSVGGFFWMFIGWDGVGVDWIVVGFGLNYCYF